MPTFQLTANHQLYRAGSGLFIEKGHQINININVMGLTPYNLFNNERCKDALIQQFKLNNIDVPYSDVGVYSRGLWTIKML